MKRKGQYLALESVITVGLGLSIAIGTINLFTDYRANALDAGEEKKVNSVESKIISSLYHLEESDQGHVTVQLPDKIGGSDYKVAFQNGVKIATAEKTYSQELSNIQRNYKLTGVANGGSVKIFKNKTQFIIRSE